MQRLDWNKLLSTKRLRAEVRGTSQEKKHNDKFVARNEFEADYDRIVGSSSVRRLQDKAQVFPLQDNDFVRTRLTHSMEVSALARSLGKAVGRKLEQIDEKNFSEEMTDQLAALLQTAGLIHDLGNPPFGHYGEQIIRNWFASWIETKKDTEHEEWENDFLNFDGNVQNLRIVMKLQTLNDLYGANFTYATLATIMKYPYPASEMERYGKKKFGYFLSEKQFAEMVRNEMGLAEGVRHPATYLLEAADDVIFICDDIEDGVKKGYIDWDDEYQKLKKKLSGKEEWKELFQTIDKKDPEAEIKDRDERKQAQVRNFRNYVQSYLFVKAGKEFIESYDLIMESSYGLKELLDCEGDFVKEIKGITRRNCFNCHEVLALELVGDKVIRSLLEIFVKTLYECENKMELLDTKTYAGKIYSLISANFKYVALYDYTAQQQKPIEKLTKEDLLHLVVDFVSGMTDSYALNLYKELTGIELPRGSM